MELAAAEVDHRAMTAELRALMSAATKQAATGVPQRIRRTVVDSTPSWGLGRFYCLVLGTIAPPLAASTSVRSYTYANAGDRANASYADRSIPDGPRLASELTTAHSLAISRLSERNALDVEIQKKFSIAIACMVFILIGAPVALRFPRGGVGLVIGVSLSVFALYYVGLIAGEDLANKNLFAPFWAMWSTNFVLTLVGAVLLARMGREGNTARGGDMSELIDSIRAWLAKPLRRLGVHADRRRHAR